MNRTRIVLAALPLGFLLSGGVARAAEPGLFVGIDGGVSQATNENYQAEVHTGGSANPFVGYMFNKYLGAEGMLNFTFNPPDNDHRGFPSENQWTTLFGATAGPRLSLPIGDKIDVYGLALGGYYTGLSGRLNHSAPGFSVGGGIDYNLTREISVGAFGRWNRVYMAPQPNGSALVYQDPSAAVPADIRFVTAGLALKYTFAEAPPKPVPPPPPPPVAKPAPPVKKKIVLRSVHFDFNKANIRPDAIPVLDEAVNVLKEEGTVGVICAGHTDNIGSDAYNMKLSRRRADAVRAYLVSHGIPEKRIRVEAFGERNPVASNDTADGRAQNRRVELNLD